MSFLSKFLPKKKPVEIKNNIPKEKNSIKKTFSVYCHSHHGTEGAKLCPKCTALLAAVMTKIDRCPYGITKPICDRCERPCFGAGQTKEFLAIMEKSQTKMWFKHPVLAAKHKLAGLGAEYAQFKRQKIADDKTKAKEKAAKNRANAKEKKGKK